MASEIIKVPDIGADEAEVIELCVAAGDVIEAEDSIVVLESDKASMEVPAPKGGKVLAVLVKEGDTLKEGDDLFELEATDASSEADEEAPKPAASPAKAEEAETVKAASNEDNKAEAAEYPVHVPDIGADEADVIEVMVSVGDEVNEEDSLIVLESDKASMEVPSPASGKVISVSIKEGETAKQGDLILILESSNAAGQTQVDTSAPASEPETPQPAAEAKQGISEPLQVSETHQPVTNMTESRPTGEVYAGPAVRKMAREIGVDLATVPGSGPRRRITKDDVKAFIKSALKNKSAGAVAQGSGIPAVPEVDFSQFGEINIEKMSKLHKVTAANMQRSWLNVPHVTGFDEIDITDLEDFRNSLKPEAERAGVKITPLPFILKACAQALKAHPIINSSLHSDGESIVYKNYVHIGFAVDTPAGLMVPVIRDVDKKSLFELAGETAELAQLAKERKLKPAQMQGGSFTVSSLGPMGGTGFTPIVNTPEVAILGVSKLDIKPRWNGESFEPRKMLPVSLSYDHRAVNGGDAGRFLMTLNAMLADLRRMVL